MEDAHQKPDFRTTYSAVKREIERRRRPFSVLRTVIFALLLAFAYELGDRLAVRFSLSGFEKTLLDFLFGFPVVLALLVTQWRIPIRRNRTSRSV